MSGELQVHGVYNPKGTICMECGVPDCEHFALEAPQPEDSRIMQGMKLALRKMVAHGFQPFVYSPYVPLIITSTGGGCNERRGQ